MTTTPDVAALTQFDYLLNAFEQASQSDEPAKHGYEAKRRALFAQVRQLESDSAALRAAEQRAEAAEAKYEVLRNAGSLLKLYVYDDPADPCSGDWRYKPSPEAVDAFVSAALKQGEQPCEPL